MAMAFTGQRPIVILDEPTTGLDPNTRRNCWQYSFLQLFTFSGSKLVFYAVDFMVIQQVHSKGKVARTDNDFDHAFNGGGTEIQNFIQILLKF